jgi:hypothetical protein
MSMFIHSRLAVITVGLNEMKRKSSPTQTNEIHMNGLSIQWNDNFPDVQINWVCLC